MRTPFLHLLSTVLVPLLTLSCVFANEARSQSSAAANKKAANKKHEWPQFLGPNRNGLSAEKGLLEDWPQDGPPVVWRAAGGVGMSGLAISGGRIVTLVQRDGNQQVLVLDQKTGKQIRSLSIAPQYRNQQGMGPRATPTLVGDMAYCLTGEGLLVAVDLAAGKVVWSHNVVRENGGRPAEYGMACSPLVVGNTVVVTAGATEATVVAFDRKSGKLAWKSGTDEPCGYSSPALLKVGGREQIVVFTGKSAVGLSPKSGDRLWRYSYVTDYECNIATPLAYDGNVFLSAGENHGCALLHLKSKGKLFDVESKWTSFGRSSVMRNEWQTSIILGGYLYGMDNVGGAGPITHLNCVNLKTGALAWRQARFGKGNLIAADGKLWIVTISGELVLVRATPDEYDEIGRTKVFGSTRQAPSLVAGHLYLRDGKEVVCLDIRQH